MQTLIIFILLISTFWIFRISANKKKWNQVSLRAFKSKFITKNTKLSYEEIKNQLNKLSINSNYKLSNLEPDLLVFEDKKPNLSILREMFFYPLRFIKDSVGNIQIEIDAIDKSSFLGNSMNRVNKLKEFHDFISQVIK